MEPCTATVSLFIFTIFPVSRSSYIVAQGSDYILIDSISLVRKTSKQVINLRQTHNLGHWLKIAKKELSVQTRIGQGLEKDHYLHNRMIFIEKALEGIGSMSCAA